MSQSVFIAIIVISVLVFIVVYALWFFFIKNFKKFATHEIVAISNGILGKYYEDDENGVEILQRYRYQKGGEALINPLTQSVRVLPANTTKLEVESKDMRTADDYFISATTVIIFSIDASSEIAMKTAFQSFGNLANKKIEDFEKGILKILEPLVDSATSTIVGRLTYDDLKKDENKFNTEAKNTIKEKFQEMGLIITSISLKNDAINNPLYNKALEERKTLEINKELEEEKLKHKEILAEQTLQSEKHTNEIEMQIKEQELQIEIKNLEQTAEKEKVEAEVEIEIKKRKHKHLLEEERQKHEQTILETEQKIELEEKELDQKILFTKKELEEQNVIKQKEFEYKIQLEKQKIEEIEVQKEQQFIVDSNDEKYRTKLSEFKKERLEADQEISYREAEHNIKLFDLTEKSKIVVEKEIEEIHSSIEEIKSELLKTKESNRLDIKERNLSIEAVNQRAKIEAQNQANFYTFMDELLKQNPTVIENSIEKILGSKGMAGVASGLTKHLGSIESIRIADLGGNGQGNGESAIEKYAHIPPNILAKFTTRLNALGFGNLLSKFKIGTNSFDNLGESNSNKIKDILFDEKNNTLIFNKDFFEELLDKVGLEKEMLDELLEESKKANINIKQS